MDIPVILTPKIGDVDPPIGFWIKERDGVTILQFFLNTFS